MLPPEEAFTDDHVRVELLIYGAIAAVTRGDLEAASEEWSRITAELTAHFDTEEAHLDNMGLSRVEARAILSEHAYFRTRLRELRVLLEERRGGAKALRAFAAELQAHGVREEALFRSKSAREEGIES